jgi:hypothetical protein
LDELTVFSKIFDNSDNFKNLARIKDRRKKMKKKLIFGLGATVLFAMLMLSGCEVSTANMSGLKTATDKEGKSATSTFKPGDTFYGIATIANNPGTVKVKTYWTDPKGSVIKSTESTTEVQGDGNATFSIPINEAMPPGEYKITAEMLNSSGEKKDSKTANFTLAGE